MELTQHKNTVNYNPLKLSAIFLSGCLRINIEKGCFKSTVMQKISLASVQMIQVRNINMFQVSDPFTRRKTQPVLATHVLRKEGDARTAAEVDTEHQLLN